MNAQSDDFRHLLSSLDIALVVSTYQAGKLMTVGGDPEHFCVRESRFHRPMGIAVSANHVALGTSNHVWTIRREPWLLPSAEDEHGAGDSPCTGHVTGDVRVHEMAYVGPELWLVNTRYSCLCSLGPHGSLVPRWKPWFVSDLVAEDRCHLNGLALVDDRVRYVTALGETDAREQWRDERASGGILIDVSAGEIVARGLSMPHSPRVYAGRLWVANSGWGSLCTVDPRNGHVETVCALPGFTRGLAFHGRYAFVGLSKVRAKRPFAGVPIAEHTQPLQCAVYAVDIESGNVAGFLQFEAGSEELFDVQVVARSGAGNINVTGMRENHSRCV